MGTMIPVRMATFAALLGASIAQAKDPLDVVDGMDEWSDKRRRLPERDIDVTQDMNGPTRMASGAVRSQLREVRVESDGFEEAQFRFDNERRDFAHDRAQLRSVRESRRQPAFTLTSVDRAPSSATVAERRKGRKPAVTEAEDEQEALEREARRLEERAMRNLERSQGLPPTRRSPPEDREIEVSPPQTSRRGEPERSRASVDAAFEDERGRRAISPREEAAARAAEERQAEKARKLEEQRLLAEEARRREEEEERRKEDAVRAAAAAKAAERKAAEDAAKKLGGKLDKDGQFVDPDLP